MIEGRSSAAAQPPVPSSEAALFASKFGVRFTTHWRELPKRSSKNSGRTLPASSRTIPLCLALLVVRVSGLFLWNPLIFPQMQVCPDGVPCLCAAGSFWCCFAQAAWPRRQPAPAHLAPSRPPASTGPPRVLAPMVLMLFPLLSRGQQRGLSLWTQWRSSTGRQISRA